MIATILAAAAAFSPAAAPAQPAPVAWPDGVWEYEGTFKKKGGLYGPVQFQHSYVGPIPGGGSKVRLGGVGFALTKPSPAASLGRGRFTLKGRFSGPSAAKLTGTVTMTQHQVLGAKCRARGTFRGKRSYQVA